MAKDLNEIAKGIARLTTEGNRPAKNPAAVSLGHLGGLKGGKARAKALTPEKRKEIAQKAIAARWNKAKKKA